MRLSRLFSYNCNPGIRSLGANEFEVSSYGMWTKDSCRSPVNKGTNSRLGVTKHTDVYETS